MKRPNPGHPDDDDAFSYESDRVHLAKTNPRTGRRGTRWTVTTDLHTACCDAWTSRPRRTLRADLVTCATCLRIVRLVETNACGAVFATRFEPCPRSCVLPRDHAGDHSDAIEA
jgi:hypothetical protein